VGIYPVLILLGGIVAADTTSGPQILISEPIVVCSMLGMLFGFPETGILIGIVYQLLWLGYLPLGGTVFTDSNMAAFVSTASLFAASDMFNLSGAAMKAAFIPAMLFSVIVGYTGLRLHVYEQHINGRRNDALLSRLESGKLPSITRLHLSGIVTAFLKGAFMTAVFIPAGTLLCGMVSYLPDSFFEGMSNASMMITGTVTASAILFYRTKGKNKSLIFGAIGGFAWIMLILKTG
jgi:mannose/fructose/N-acetylgalactosamine-specific phosphotransferase system component IIC